MPAHKENVRLYYDNYCELILTDRRGHESGRTKVDIEDVSKIAQGRWCLDSVGYAYNFYMGRLHRIIIDAPKGVWVDHISYDKLDNRKVNLRLATPSQNIHHSGVHVNSTSGVKGVSWSKKRNKWRAYVWKEGKQHNAGFFDSLQTAADRRDQKALQLFGEYAYLNSANKT